MSDEKINIEHCYGWAAVSPSLIETPNYVFRGKWVDLLNMVSASACIGVTFAIFMWLIRL